MNKLYLLPISLLLLNPGYADEKAAVPLFSEVKIVSQDASKGETEIYEQEVSASWEEQNTGSYTIPRARKQLPQYRDERADEEEFQEEEVIEAPRVKARPYSGQSAHAPRAQSEQSATSDQDVQQPLENKQGSHVRRYPTQSSKTPRVQADNGDEQQEQRSSIHRQPSQSENQRPRSRPQQAQPAKTPRTYPNTVDAEDRQNQRLQARPKQAPKLQEDTADTEFEYPVQQQKKSPARSQSSQMTQENRAPANPSAPSQHRRQGQANQTQRKAPQQQGMSKSSAYDKSGAYTPPARPSTGSHKPARAPSDNSQKKVAQMNSSQNQYSDDQMDQQGQMNQQGRKGMKAQNGDNQMMVNTPARPAVQNGYDFWLMGDTLLWQAVEENLTYAYTGNSTNGVHRTLHTVDFDWDWGFRFGIGYNTPRDGWDIDLYWTHIRNNAHGHVQSSDEDSIFQIWTVAGHTLPGTIAKASGHWHVHLDQVDLDLGREFYVGKHLTIRPFVGARSTWLFQEHEVKTHNTIGNAQEAHLKNRFWGFGFVAGLDTDWKLGCGISLYGEADMAVLLGFFDVDENGKQDDTRIWSLDKSFRVGRAIMDLGLGLKWMTLFNNDRFGVTLKAGYEYHLYFDQNQFILTNSSTNFELFNPVNGNLIYQGVIGSIQFDF